jgi:hypothetical protein
LHYKIKKDYRDNDERKHSFNELAAETFGLNFEPWYRNEFWKESYNPYFFVRGDSLLQDMSTILSFPEITHA